MLSPYGAREARFTADARSAARVSVRFSSARLAIAATTALLAIAWLSDPTRTWAGPAVAATVAAFLVLVIRHDRVEQRRDVAAALATVNRDAQRRLDRDWSAMPATWQVDGIDDHPYAGDLNLFGHASLSGILGPVQTPTGRVLLSRWLLQGPAHAEPDVIARHQEAVRELAPLLDLRQQLTVAARRIPALNRVPASLVEPPISATGPSAESRALKGEPPLVRFVGWAESPSWLLSRPWVSIVAIALGLVTTSLFMLWLAGWPVAPWWLATATAGWMLRAYVRHPLEQTFGGASTEHGVRSWTTPIGLIETARWQAVELKAAQATLATGGQARRSLRRLEQLVALADFRLSTWLYLPIQSLTLWELHVWWAMERWRHAHGRHVAEWLTAVGRVEALSALASLAHDHPAWAFPEVSPRHHRLEADALAHPLLADAVRVANDVKLGPPGRFLLITGSNMSGKSTLLRSLGVGIVLAHAGGPVCASRMTLPPMTLHTSMRVADSLERGLSLFMASLVRLERIVRSAREANGRVMGYLLDEVLQGTNSAERQVAVRTIVGHLLGTRAIGAVTTHDLELAHDAAFTLNADSFHLQETLARHGEDVSMTFDYRLRPGPAEAGNALELLRMLGLR